MFDVCVCVSSGNDSVSNYDVVVIGAGLIGMATAQELITRHPSLTYCVVEKEDRVGWLLYYILGKCCTQTGCGGHTSLKVPEENFLFYLDLGST